MTVATQTHTWRVSSQAMTYEKYMLLGNAFPECFFLQSRLLQPQNMATYSQDDKKNAENQTQLKMTEAVQ